MQVTLHQLATWTQRIRKAWPHLELPMDAFALRLTELLASPGRTLSDANQLELEDLALAFACSRKDPVALRIFETEYGVELQLVTARFRLSHAELQDIHQTLWQKLFVSSDGLSAKILEYQGVGRLRSWFRSVAARTILDYLRVRGSGEKRQAPLDLQSLAIAAADSDAELALIRSRYQGAFKQALEAALFALSPEERNAIRCHYLLGMTTEQMAAAFGSHRVTVSRRIARARERIYAATRERLRASLAAQSAELDSIMRLYDIDLPITLSRILG